MKKKLVLILLAVSLLSMSACSQKVEAVGDKNAEGISVENASDVFDAVTSPETAAVSESAPEAVESVETTTEVMTTEPVTEETTSQTEAANEVAGLSEEEKAKRKADQASYANARAELYNQANSLDKTIQINEMDKKILANNTYDFSDKNVLFIGDSITQAICGDTDADGNFISFVNYANDYLRFGNVLNHGVAGRMFSNYGGDDLSLSMNLGNIMNNDADIVIVYAGVNDYLTSMENKRYGDVNDTMSTAGYCGSLRYFMQQLKSNYPDKEFFFVTTYNISKTSTCTYSDISPAPTLADYMSVERTMAQQNGYHVIELFSTGFMDATNADTANYYLADGLHPNNNGNIILGEHIAAELSLYYSQQ